MSRERRALWKTTRGAFAREGEGRGIAPGIVRMTMPFSAVELGRSDLGD